MAYAWKSNDKISVVCDECGEKAQGDRFILRRDENWCWGEVRSSGEKGRFALCGDHKDLSGDYFEKIGEELA